MGSCQGSGKVFYSHIIFYVYTTQETISAEELSQLISELDVKMANYQVRPCRHLCPKYKLEGFESHNIVPYMPPFLIHFIRSTILIVKWISFLFKRSRQRCQWRSIVPFSLDGEKIERIIMYMI